MATREAEPIGRGKRAYILGPNDLPIYVGEGVGDLDYNDAVRLSAVRAAARGELQSGQTVTPGSISQIVPLEIEHSNPPERRKREWRDYRGTSKKTAHTFRASKNNPYICDHCSYRTTRYSNMIAHLERVHGDYATDPRNKSFAVKQGIVGILKEWKAL